MTSPTAKGDAFEKQIYRFFRKFIDQGLFPVGPENCRLFAKKGYWSRDREKEIIFDISIEIYLPGTDEVCMIYLIECKNYASPVPVDDSEEFFAKIQQVSASKGVIVSRGSFQEGTVKFCKSKRIGLLRYFSRERVKWELHRSPSAFWIRNGHRGNPEAIFKELTTPEIRSRFDFCGSYASTDTNSLHDFFASIAVDSGLLGEISGRPARLQSPIEFITLDSMETRAGAILDEIGYNDGAVPLTAICERHPYCRGLALHQLVPPSEREISEGILGRLTFDPFEISIFDVQGGTDERRRFTLAHELAHVFLGHGSYMRGEVSQECDLEPSSIAPVGGDDISRMEWQANQLASCLLVPIRPLAIDMAVLARKHNLVLRGGALLYLDGQRCNIDIYHEITDLLKHKYGVSRTVVKMRLERLGLMKDETPRPTRIGNSLAFGYKQRRF